ncbi:MAG TPA: PAS domain S-box protein, partial [Armatimonadota bacterium]
MTASYPILSTRLRLLQEVRGHLFRAHTVDELCRLAVELGCSRLGFDRLSIWFAEGQQRARGSYGLDETGQIRDERQSWVTVAPSSSMGRVFSGETDLVLEPADCLLNHSAMPVGQGMHALAALWDGLVVLGCVSADNLLTHTPFTDEDGEILRLYASIIGHLYLQKQAEASLQRATGALTSFLDLVPDLVCTISPENLFDMLNPAWEATLGFPPETLLHTPFMALVHPEDREATFREMAHLEMGHRPACFINRYRCHDGSYRWVEWEVVASAHQQIYAVGRDITARKTADDEREVTLRLLRLLADCNGVPELLTQMTQLMQDWSGCAAVGIRLREDADFPYYETRGFPPEFVEKETYLCAVDEAGMPVCDPTGHPLLECVCGNILRGCFDPRLPCYTEHGSYWTNSTTDLLASLGEQDRPYHMRNRCNRMGYESVALIPIPHGAQIIGLLQFNDPRRDRFTAADIALYERLAGSLAIGIIERQAAETLQASQAQLRGYFEHAPFAIYLFDETGRILETNSEAYRVTGYSEAELRSMHYSDLLAPALPQEGENYFKRLTKKGFVQWEVRYQMKSGGLRWGAISAVKLSETRFLAFTQDITERKQAEQALRESEERYRRIVETAQEGIWILDATLHTAYVNQRLTEILGYTSEEMLGKPPDAFLFEEDLPDQALRMARRQEQQNELYERRYHRKDGGTIWCLISAHAITDDAGNFAGSFAMLADITKRKLAEEALRESEERLKLAIFGTDLGTWDWNIAHGEVTFNEQWADMLGYALDELPPMIDTWISLLHPDDLPRVRQALNAHLGGTTNFYEAEYRLRHKSGHWVWVLGKGRVIEWDAQGQPLRACGTQLDMTVRKQAELALQTSEL